MSNLDDQTLEILAGLNAAQPSTQQVDYSGFMQDFQPVLNQPNYFVPQQGLLQNTPTLDTLSDLDVMQQRPQVVTNMLDQYPTLESDFQRSFAVSPDTFNMNVYQPLPYDPNYWQSFVNQGGGTTGGGVDLGTGLGLVAGATSLLGGDDGDDGDDNGDDGDDNGDGNDNGNNGDGSSGTNVITANTTLTDTSVTQTGQGGDVESGSSDVVKVTITDDDDSSQSTGQGGDVESGSSDVLKVTTTDSSDSQSQTGEGGDVESGSSDVTKVSNFDINDTSTWAWGGSPFKLNIETADGNVNVIEIQSKEELDRLIKTQNVFNSQGFGASVFQSDVIGTLLGDNLVNTGSGLNFTTEFGVDKTGLTGIGKTFVDDAAEDILINNAKNLINTSKAALAQFEFVGVGNNPNAWAYNRNNNTWLTKAEYDLVADPLKANLQEGNAIAETLSSTYDDGGDIFSDAAQNVSDFLNKEIIAGTGGEGYLGKLTNVKVGEALSGIGGLLSLADMVDDANVGNTLGTAAGLSGFGLFGEAAQGIAPALGAGALIASLAGLGQPDPSNEAGFAQVDTNSNNVTPFGMEGDKFNQENVNQSTSIANAMNNVVNNITGNYGLKTEGDILVQTGERDPLNVTFGDMSEEPTINNRLNYNTKEGDILNTTNDVSRFYYTGQVGNDGSALVDNIIKGTNLLSLKAVANDEDTINMKDFRLPAFSEDKVKNQYLDMGLDETAANALTSASRSGSAATSELLGGLLVANTTNEDLFLTDAEKTSLLEKGYTEEQLDTILYG